MAQPFPPLEAVVVWAGRAPHLVHAETTFPDVTPSQDVILRIIVSPTTSIEKTAEITELLRLFVSYNVT